ncbi:MAG: MaoC family dehydratase [Oceanococcus sp.]
MNTTPHFSEPTAGLLREQWPAISGMTGGLLRSFIPEKIKSALTDSDKVYTDTVNSGSDKLVDHYSDWCRVNDPQRYATTLPPHFFSKYGMNMVARVTSLVPYNMLSVLNQGCHIRINAALPRHTPLQLKGELVDCSRDGNRVRIHTRVTVGTADIENAMTVDTMAAVMLGKQEKKAKVERQEPDWQTIDEWSADRNEGVRFFYLTGDFNPIHTFWPMAKRSRFGGCILHGFGSLSRTFESIQNSGLGITDFDARFVKPHLLPSGPNQVQISDVDNHGRQNMRLINAKGEVMLAGTFSATKA